MSGGGHPCQTGRHGDEQSKPRTGRTCRTRASPATAYSSMPYRESFRVAELRDAPVRTADPVRVTKPDRLLGKLHISRTLWCRANECQNRRARYVPRRQHAVRDWLLSSREWPVRLFFDAPSAARDPIQTCPRFHPPLASKAGSETCSTDVRVRRETPISNTPHDGLGSSLYSTISPLELHLAALAFVGSSPAQAVGKSQAGPPGTRPSTGLAERVCPPDGGDVRTAVGSGPRRLPM